MRLLGWGGTLCSVNCWKLPFFSLVKFSIAFYGVNAFCYQCNISLLPLSAVHSSSSYLWWRQLAWDLQGLLGGNPRWKTEKKLSQDLRGKYSSYGCWHMCTATKKAACHVHPKQGWKVKAEQNTTPPSSHLWPWLQKQVLLPNVAPFPACPDWPFGTTEQTRLSCRTKVKCRVWKALIDLELLSLALSHILRANQSCSMAVTKRGCCSVQTRAAGLTFVPRTRMMFGSC